MKEFYKIATPHGDIVSGRLTMDIFAADLSKVVKGEGPIEYRDAKMFFDKTYETEGLKSLLRIIKQRLEGKGGDPVIQLQTPFGGGKTHSLIAMYHKAKEWGVKPVVIVGTNLQAKDTLWEILERQLTGSSKQLEGLTSPGKDKLFKLLEPLQPLVILMDEVLEYATKASGVMVGKSTLMDQLLVFMQELTEVVSSLEKVCLVITLPTSDTEHYGIQAEKLFQKLKKITGRMEKIYTPVEESEIAHVIRRRLFRQIDEDDMKKVVSSFVKYAEKEGLLPSGVEPTVYRDKFLGSYPFMPEVIEVLYHRWGSFNDFQRTRGVLRLLALVVSSLIRTESKVSYISLADFNLKSSDLREELLKYIGAEYNSVIAQDITDYNSGSEKINQSLGSSYKGLQLGTRVTTTIFMYSFSGGTEKGATLQEIKRSATTLNNPSSVVGDMVEQLKDKLFYFQFYGGKYFFSNQPNLNRIVLTKMENIKGGEVGSFCKQLLEKALKGNSAPMRVYIYPKNSGDVPDTEEFKLIVFENGDESEIGDVLREFIGFKGKNVPRTNCNVMFFMIPDESVRLFFENKVKEYLAYQKIESDRTLQLSDEQRKEIRIKLDRLDKDLNIRELYKFLVLPSREGYKNVNLGIPTLGMYGNIVEEVYQRLKSDQKILESLAPMVLERMYLGEKEYVGTKQILDSFYRTPGKERIASKEVLEKCILEGVEKGFFGLGEEIGNKPVCKFYMERPSVSFENNEVIISKRLCGKEIEGGSVKKREGAVVKNGTVGVYTTGQNRVEGVQEEEKITVRREEYLDKLSLKFKLPKAKVSDIVQIIKVIDTKFDDVHFVIEAKSGGISKQDYEMKIEEAFHQLGIKLE